MHRRYAAVAPALPVPFSSLRAEEIDVANQWVATNDMPFAVTLEKGCLKVAGLAIDTVGRSLGGCTDNVHTVSEALWVTMPGSSIKTLHDLKGKCLNFTNPQSMPVSPRN